MNLAKPDSSWLRQWGADLRGARAPCIPETCYLGSELARMDQGQADLKVGFARLETRMGAMETRMGRTA